jgi:flagellar motor switch protein FliN/FliY
MDSVTPRDALVRLGASTAEAVAQALEMFAPGQIQRGEVSVLADATTAFASLPFGAVAASVSYVHGVTGANVFLMTPQGARTLATSMGVPPPDEDDVALTELELSAIAEAANQMMAAAASAIGVVLGQEIEISPPDTRVLDDTDSALELYGTAPHATSTTFVIGTETCRLIQLVPSAFVVRMVRAIDEQRMEEAGMIEPAAGGPSEDQGPPADDTAAITVGLEQALSEIRLRVWAELGRTQMPLGTALALQLGAVVDLDNAADAPVDLYVNGMRFAQGHLLITDDGEWAVCLENLGSLESQAEPAVSAQPQLEGALT